MDYPRVEHIIEGFLKQYSGKDFCRECIITHAAITEQEDQVRARHILCIIPAWVKRANLWKCSQCGQVANTWRWELPRVRVVADKP